MAREESFEVHDDRFDDQPERGRESGTGWSRSSRWILGLLGCFGVSLVVCCGVGAVLVNQFVKQVENAFTRDPVRIAEIQESITSIDLPAQFPPQGAGDIDVFGVFKMNLVMYGDEGGDSLLMLMQMTVSGVSEEEMITQFQRQAQSQGSDDFKVESSETRQFTINGRDCDFEFAKGTLKRQAGERLLEGAGPPAEEVPAQPNAPAAIDAPAGPEVPANDAEQEVSARQVSGMFPGRNGMAYMVLIVAEKDWDEDAVIKLIESIHN